MSSTYSTALLSSGPSATSSCPTSTARGRSRAQCRGRKEEGNRIGREVPAIGRVPRPRDVAGAGIDGLLLSGEPLGGASIQNEAGPPPRGHLCLIHHEAGQPSRGKEGGAG